MFACAIAFESDEKILPLIFSFYACATKLIARNKMKSRFIWVELFIGIGTI